MDTADSTPLPALCWSHVCGGSCGAVHPVTSVPERDVHWSWLPTAGVRAPRYMGERLGVVMHGRGNADPDPDPDPDDMSNES